MDVEINSVHLNHRAPATDVRTVEGQILVKSYFIGLFKCAEDFNSGELAGIYFIALNTQVFILIPIY